jgi:hypothetical protein
VVRRATRYSSHHQQPWIYILKKWVWMQGNRGGCFVLERRQREFNLEREFFFFYLTIRFVVKSENRELFNYIILIGLSLNQIDVIIYTNKDEKLYFTNDLFELHNIYNLEFGA